MKQGMNRRKTIDGKKNALTVGTSGVIEGAIYRARDRYVKTMLSWDKPTWWFVERAFDEVVLQACRDGYKYSEERTWAKEYPLNEGVTIRICSREWNNEEMLAPSPDYMHVTDTIPELMAYCIQVREILVQFAKVRHVFKWLNRSCKTGASIRNYAPWVQSCIGDFPMFGNTRFTEPDGLAPMLPLIREAATTMATVLLIHDDPAGRPTCGFDLHFKESQVITGGHIIDIPLYIDSPSR